MHPTTGTWRFVGTSGEGQRFEIEGVNVWSSKWTRDTVAGDADVKDPLYGQSFTFHVYVVRTGSNLARFAAGEFSNGVFGFFVEDQQNA